jgi:hypothetical protein
VVDAVRVGRRIDDDAAAGIGGGNREKTVAQTLMKRPIELLEAVLDHRTPADAGEPFLDRHIEDHGQVGPEIGQRKPVQFAQVRERQAAAVTLIGDGRIGEPVGDDPRAGSEGRPDQSDDMIAPRRVQQQGLGNGIPALGVTLEQQTANILGTGRAAWLARALGGDAGTCEGRDEESGLGRFAGPLAAFDGDEAAARRAFVTGAQLRLPQIRWAAIIAARPIGPRRATVAAA